MSHIKFWKMASTFTGLKLQGELGRFGKTEYSDIVAIIPMPDEKVGIYTNFLFNLLCCLLELNFKYMVSQQGE